MAAIPEKHLDPEQIRRIASDYLQELARYYEEQENTPAALSPAAASIDHETLERKVGELLSAIAQFADPQERRRAVLRVLRIQEQHEQDTPG